MEENRIDSSASVSGSCKILIAGLWLQRALELGKWDLNTTSGAGCVCVAGDCAWSCTARLPPIHSLPALSERLEKRRRGSKAAPAHLRAASLCRATQTPQSPPRGAVRLREQHTRSSVADGSPR